MSKKRKPGIKKSRRIRWEFLLALAIVVIFFILFVVLGLYLGTLV